jgi:Fic family protein
MWVMLMARVIALTTRYLMRHALRCWPLVHRSRRASAERAARLHVDFVKIHPFVDGNGRTARLLLNLELLKAGFPAVVLPVERRLAY